MSKSVKLTGGKYGLKERLISIKNKEIEIYTKILAEREQGIETQSSQIAEIAESTSNKIAQVEKEYSIRIRNNDREHEQLVRELDAAKADLEVAKVELEKCSFLAVSKKKALTEDVSDIFGQILIRVKHFSALGGRKMIILKRRSLKMSLIKLLTIFVKSLKLLS
jgi:hypothetical protein